MDKMTQSDLAQAREIVDKHLVPTPQYAWPLLCQELGLDIWVKHENHTPIGAFKVRGGLVHLHRLFSRPKPPEQIITATRGNHGQSIPYAARQYGIPVTVLVPKGNSEEKNAAMLAWGATVEVFGADFDAARQEAERRSQAGEGELVPAFHEDLIHGVATYGHELMNAVPDLDAIYCPIGMGSGICSLVQMRNLLGRRTHIIGVVSSHADAMAQSFDSGKVICTDSAHTFADGVATRIPNEAAMDFIRQGVERVVTVTDEEAAEAIRRLYRCTHNIAEGAGAIACAAAFQEREKMKGKKVAVILTGGNIDAAWLSQVLQGQTPRV